MKINHLLILIAIAMCVNIQAQNKNSIDKLKLVASYQCIVNTFNEKGENINDSCMMALEVGHKFNKFEPLATFLCDSATNYRKNITKEEQEKLMIKSVEESTFNMPLVYQNYPKGKMTVREAWFPSYYIYQENIKPMQWTLSEDTISVCGYPCRKATTRYGGRNWTVWYTEDIPVMAGPWKFGGLPGLILKAEDSDNLWSMTLASIIKTDVPILYSSNAKDNKTERKDFIQFRATILPKMTLKGVSGAAVNSRGYHYLRKAIGLSQVKSMSVYEGAIIINDCPPLPSVNKEIIPLELE